MTTEGFTWIIKLIVELAAEHAGGRLISVLEGGYSIRRLPELACNHIKVLMDA
ncbi:MAG: hypothetical protein PVF29_18525 [Desulfobacterales bacterium]